MTKNFGQKFKDDPVKAVESVLGIDLPDDQINSIIDGVKAKLSLDSASDALGSIKKAVLGRRRRYMTEREKTHKKSSRYVHRRLQLCAIYSRLRFHDLVGMDENRHHQKPVPLSAAA